MRSNNVSLGLLSIGCTAILAVACGSEGEFGGEPMDEKPAMDEDFDYAPEAVEEYNAGELAEYPEKGKELVGKSTVELYRAFTWSESVYIPNGATVTFETTGATDAVDPVLVLYMRNAPWNDSRWVDQMGWTDRVQITTLAQNDDLGGGNRNARISYYNNTGNNLNAWVMGFSYLSRAGTLDVYRDGGHIGAKNFTSGGYYVNSYAGEIYSTGGGDPVLFAFHAVDGGGAGAWNDDDPTGALGYDSRIQNITNEGVWVVPMLYPSFSTRVEGWSTITY